MKKAGNMPRRKTTMLKRVLLFLVLYLIVLALSILWIGNISSYLFLKIPWFLALAVFLGLLAGVLKAKLKDTTGVAAPVGWVKRHNSGSFLEHWGTVFGLFLLVISGYLLHAKASLFMTNFHFLGLFFTLLFGCYFLADFFASRKYNDLLPSQTDIVEGTIKKYLFRAKWNDAGKYIASQKSAFLAFLTLGIGISITGFVKLAGILWRIPVEVIKISTVIHDIAALLFVLMVIVHILLVVSVRLHRRLFRSWFTGIIPESSQKTETTPAVQPKVDSP